MTFNCNKIILTITLIVSSFLMYGQSVCINFDDLTVGTQYGNPVGQSPETLILSQENVDFTLQELQISLPEGEVYNKAEIVDASSLGFGLPEGNLLHLEDARLLLDFANITQGVRAISFDYYEVSGLVNFTADGLLATIINTDVASDYINSIPYSIPDIDGSGNVYYEGDISQILFGGENVYIDNLCIWYEDDFCNTSNYAMTMIPCDADNAFYSVITFDAEGVGNQGFTVSVNGESTAMFNYNEAPYQIGPLFGDGVTTYEITIQDNQFDCEFESFTIEPQGCSPDCAIGDVTFEYIECTEATLGTYLLDFNYANPESDVFSVSVEGDPFVYYNYSELPVVVSLPVFTEAPIVTICDTAVVNCCTNVEYDWQYCAENSCDIGTSIQEIICTGDEFYLVIGTDGGGYYEAGYSTYINGEFIESIPPGFSYPDTIGPILGPIAGSPEDYTLTLVANAFPSCTAEIFVGTVDLEECTFDQQICALDIVNMSTSECLNDEFYFEFDIDTSYLAQNGGSDSFNLQIGWYDEGGLGGFIYGQDFGNIEYSDEGYSIGPFSTNPDTSYLITARDVNLNFACGETYNEYLLPPPCDVDGCEVNGLEVTASECYEGGLVDLTLNFFVDGEIEIGLAEFSLTIGTTEFGNFAVTSLPFTVLGFPANGQSAVVTVCIVDEGDCCESTFVEIPNCEGFIGVYPGDCNDDNICNNFDVLNVGLGNLGTGAARLVSGTDWQEYQVANWSNIFASSVNYAHADANGNGEISADDIDVITQNYSLTHGDVAPFVEQEATPDSPDLFADLPDNFEITQGEAFNVPIVLGSMDNQIASIYGLSFTLQYDPTVIDPNSAQMQYATSWFGVPQTNLITFDRHDMTTGEIDITIVRNDQNNTSGFGEIMHFIGVVDNIAGKSEISVTVKDVLAITKSEMLLAFNKPVEIASITRTDNIALKNGFEIYPNPSSDWLFVKNKMGLEIDQVQITDMNGRLLRTVNAVTRVSTADLPAGVYWVRCVADDTVGHLRMVKL